MPRKSISPTHRCAILLSGICLVCGREPDTVVVKFRIGGYFIHKKEPGSFELTAPGGERMIVDEAILENFWNEFHLFG